MYKTDFFIAKGKKRNDRGNVGSYEFERVSGYGELFEAPNGTLIEIGIYKSGDEWVATEISTGLSLGKHGATRSKVLKKITPEFLLSVSKVMKTMLVKEIAEDLENYILQDGKGSKKYENK